MENQSLREIKQFRLRLNRTAVVKRSRTHVRRAHASACRWDCRHRSYTPRVPSVRVCGIFEKGVLNLRGMLRTRWKPLDHPSWDRAKGNWHRVGNNFQFRQQKRGVICTRSTLCVCYHIVSIWKYRSLLIYTWYFSCLVHMPNVNVIMLFQFGNIVLCNNA